MSKFHPYRQGEEYDYIFNLNNPSKKYKDNIETFDNGVSQVYYHCPNGQQLIKFVPDFGPGPLPGPGPGPRPRPSPGPFTPSGPSPGPFTPSGPSIPPSSPSTCQNSGPIKTIGPWVEGSQSFYSYYDCFGANPGCNSEIKNLDYFSQNDSNNPKFWGMQGSEKLAQQKILEMASDLASIKTSNIQDATVNNIDGGWFVAAQPSNDAWGGIPPPYNNNKGRCYVVNSKTRKRNDCTSGNNSDQEPQCGAQVEQRNNGENIGLVVLDTRTNTSFSQPDLDHGGKPNEDPNMIGGNINTFDILSTPFSGPSNEISFSGAQIPNNYEDNWKKWQENSLNFNSTGNQFNNQSWPCQWSDGPNKPGITKKDWCGASAGGGAIDTPNWYFEYKEIECPKCVTDTINKYKKIRPGEKPAPVTPVKPYPSSKPSRRPKPPGPGPGPGPSHKPSRRPKPPGPKPGDADDQRNPKGPGWKKLDLTAFWDCSMGCTQGLGGSDDGQFASINIAPLKPPDQYKSENKETIWMSGAFAPDIIDAVGKDNHTFNNMGGNNAGGCGKCVLVKGEKWIPGTSAMVMKLDDGDLGELHHQIDMGVPGFDDDSYSKNIQNCPAKMTDDPGRNKCPKGP